MSGERIVLVDVSNLAYRSHFGSPTLVYDGVPTGALYGCLRAIRYLERAFGGTLVMCWDYGLPGDKFVQPWREKIFKNYKASRKPNPDRKLVTSQFPMIFRAFQYLGWPQLGIPGLEADDIISLLGAGDDRYLIVTTDRDVYQLLEGDRVKVVHPKRVDSKYRKITEREVVLEFQIDVQDWPAYLALGGDISDDIHVVKGLGPKTGIAMIKAGARLDRPWRLQQRGLRVDYAKYAEHWPELMNGFQVARLPSDPGDKRLPPHTTERFDAFLESPGLVRSKPNVKGFRSICADYGLRECFVRVGEYCGLKESTSEGLF